MAPGLGSFLRRLGGGRGGRDTAPAEAVDYNGYEIRPAPISEGGHWLTAGVIAKAFDDGVREHSFVRSDQHGDRESAVQFSILKARQIIDLEGDRLFD